MARNALIWILLEKIERIRLLCTTDFVLMLAWNRISSSQRAKERSKTRKYYMFRAISMTIRNIALWTGTAYFSCSCLTHTLACKHRKFGVLTLSQSGHCMMCCCTCVNGNGVIRIKQDIAWVLPFVESFLPWRSIRRTREKEKQWRASSFSPKKGRLEIY